MGRGPYNSPNVRRDMSCLEGLLRDAGRELEPQVQHQLRGFFGGMVRHYLPQVWVFETDQETVTLAVDPAGAVAVRSGRDEHADVTVRLGHDRLRAALTTRTRDRVPAGSVDVTPHTAKGKAAFGLLKGRLGL